MRRIRRFTDTARDDDDDVNSQGMLYHLSGPRPTSMARTFVVGSIAPCPGHDPLILDLYGDSAPPGRAIDLEAYMTAKERKAARGGAQADAQADAEAAEPPEAREPDVTSMSTAQRILAILPADGMTEAELQDALNEDGGREVRRGTLRTTLSSMRKQGQLARPDGSTRILPAQPAGD